MTASELPWEFGLLWMEGGLPNEATAFDLEIAWTHIRFNLFGGSVNCEYYDGVPAIMPLEGGGEGSYSADSLITDESVFIQGGVGFGCPSGVYMAGTFRFSETEWITVS